MSNSPLVADHNMKISVAAWCSSLPAGRPSVPASVLADPPVVASSWPSPLLAAFFLCPVGPTFCHRNVINATLV
jgi:hypothetical protein